MSRFNDFELLHGVSLKNLFVSIFLFFSFQYSVFGLSLTLEDAYNRLPDQVFLRENEYRKSIINELKNSRSVKSLSPGYAFEDNMYFVRTKFPFPTRIGKIRRYDKSSKAFVELETYREKIYEKVIVNELFYEALLFHEWVKIEGNSFKKNELIFEEKKRLADLKKMLNIDYKEPLELVSTLFDTVPQKITYSLNELPTTVSRNVEYIFIKKDLEVDELKLKSLKASALPNTLVTMEYWNDTKELGPVIGLEFPILDERHRSLITSTKKSIKSKENHILKVSNDIKIDFFILMEEINFLVDQIDGYRRSDKRGDSEVESEILRLKTRYMVLIENLALLFDTAPKG